MRILKVLKCLDINSRSHLYLHRFNANLCQNVQLFYILQQPREIKILVYYHFGVFSFIPNRLALSTEVDLTKKCNKDDGYENKRTLKAYQFYPITNTNLFNFGMLHIYITYLKSAKPF